MPMRHRPLHPTLSGGSPLPHPYRSNIEGQMGAAFSDVREHHHHRATMHNARSFTHESDIYVAPGHYEPHTGAGQQLLAHELTHVVQQRQGGVDSPLAQGLVAVPEASAEAPKTE